MSDAEQKDTRDLETKFRQDLGLLEWQMRDLMPVIEAHYVQPTHPVDGDINKAIDDIMEDLMVGHNLEYAGKAFKELFTAHLQAAVREAEKQGIVKGIKLVDEALLDDVTGSYPVQVVRNLIKMLIWENTPKGKQFTQSTPKPEKEK